MGFEQIILLETVGVSLVSVGLIVFLIFSFLKKKKRPAPAKAPVTLPTVEPAKEAEMLLEDEPAASDASEETAEPAASDTSEETSEPAASDASEETSEPAADAVPTAATEPSEPAEMPEPIEETEEEPAPAPALIGEGQPIPEEIYGFTAQLIRSDDEVKASYSALKNTLLSYEKISVLKSFGKETFRLEKKPIATLSMEDGALLLTLALSPASYAGTKYVVEPSDPLADSEALRYRIRSAGRTMLAKTLIADAMMAAGIPLGPRKENDYAADLAFVRDDVLREKGLIKRKNG